MNTIITYVLNNWPMLLLWYFIGIVALSVIVYIKWHFSPYKSTQREYFTQMIKACWVSWFGFVLWFYFWIKDVIQRWWRSTETKYV